MATAKKCEKDAAYFENFHQWDAEVATCSVPSQGSNYADRRVIIIIIMLTLQRHLFTSASEHFWASTSLIDVATRETAAAAARDVFQHIWFIIWLRRNKRLSGYRKPLTLCLQSRYKKMANLLLLLSKTLRTRRWSCSAVGKLWRGKWKLLHANVVFGVCHHPTCATD